MASLRNNTQRSRIINFLKSGNSITPLEALSLFGSYRLAAHVEVLRNKHGMNISTEIREDFTGRRYARYHLVKSSRVNKQGELFHA
jgi:hypothetical protein